VGEHNPLLVGAVAGRLVPGKIFVDDYAEQMVDAIEPGTLLIIRIHNVPGRLLDIDRCGQTSLS